MSSFAEGVSFSFRSTAQAEACGALRKVGDSSNRYTFTENALILTKLRCRPRAGLADAAPSRRVALRFYRAELPVKGETVDEGDGFEQAIGGEEQSGDQAVSGDAGEQW